MAKATRSYICTVCGERYPKWGGQCVKCGEWNTLEEEEAPPAAPLMGKSGSAGKRRAPPLQLARLDGKTTPPPRIHTGMEEFNRVLGGGLVPGSAVLVGGDPGIGKSTLMLQAAAALSRSGVQVLYVSGEEAIEQIRLRAKRLNLTAAPGALDRLNLAASIHVASIAESLQEMKGSADQPGAVIIDSIQTMWSDVSESAPGSVAQVRASAFELIRIAKTRGFALILIGHVTKEGALAGPRVLEHMVDAVMYFEGDRGHQFRILRAAKNRFGATDEIGVFAMGDSGLSEVPNPSALFLAERRGNIAGSAVFAGLEGTRPVLLEVQTLLSQKTGEGSARRMVLGWETARLNMLLAVLEARCGLKLHNMDIHLNIAGGLKISEPAADLAVAAALVSAATGVPAPADAAYFGEVGLSGELRQVPQTDLRLKEAGKMGFAEAIMPRPVKNVHNRPPKPPGGLRIKTFGHLSDLVASFAAQNPRPAPP